jgi:hypothetical protein
MTISRNVTAAVPMRVLPARRWRTVTALAAVTGGSAIIAGALLPWVYEFAGLIAVSGIRGLNGRVQLTAGIVVVVAGLVHLGRGDRISRWIIGLTGFGALAFAGYLLLKLTALLPSIGSGSMAMVSTGPGLWAISAGSALAFGTMFLPAARAAVPGQAGPLGPAAVPGQAGPLGRAAPRASVAAWAADRASAGPLRWLQLGLAAVWLADAALQFQPRMFGPTFVTAIIEPAAMGSPAFVATPVMSYGQLILHNPVAFNAVFASIQLALGLGIMWRRTVRAALAASIAWAAVVWWVGEGMGLIFSGHASPLTGAPGAALLYIVIAVLAWPAARSDRFAGSARADRALPGERAGWKGRPSLASVSPVRWRVARLSWLVIWGSSAYFVVAAAAGTRAALRDSVAGQAAGEPGWLASMDRSVAAAIGSRGPTVAIVLAVLFAVIALGVFVPAATRPVIVAAIVAALVIWVVGENFGGIFTGSGTDPNTGPLLALISLAFWPFTGQRLA